MGVEILNHVTLAGCTAADCSTWNQAAKVKSTTDSVKISLFGKVDHEELMSFIHQELAEMEEVKRLEWNFDFKNETPLEGTFKWQKEEKINTFKSPIRSPVKTVTKSRRRISPLKRRVNREINLDLRTNCGRQTKIIEYINISKSIANHRIEEDD